jgi:DNA polymerase
MATRRARARAESLGADRDPHRQSDVAARSAAPWVPERRSLRALRDAVQGCRGCDLWRNATQGVMGEGPRHARVMLVGEQPGDREDVEGHPFVGPAGRLLDRALADAGIARDECWVTNAVKHFKWTPRGKRRIHERPSKNEVTACRPWFQAELELVQPRVVVALGATAAQALFGASFRVTRSRGELFDTSWTPQGMATVHPSSILRARTDEERRRAFEELVADLSRLAKALDE